MAQSVETNKRSALSGWPMVIGWIAMLIFAGHASTRMVAAGDTWVALACGRHFYNHGVDTVEPFSANSHHAGPTEAEIKTWPEWAQWITAKVGLGTVKYWHPTGWINQNWLTHLIFYWLTHKSPFADADTLSFNTLVYWKVTIYILTVICIYYTSRLLGVNPALAAVFTCFAMFIGRTFLDIRPAGFSNLLVPVFLLILVLATYRSIWYIWLIVPLAVFWCNVHGGYIYEFIMLVPFVALNLLTSVSKKRFVTVGLKGVIHSIAAGFVAFVAMVLFNPFRLTNLTHTFLISVSKHAEKWRGIFEWHPAFEWDNPIGDEIPFLIMYIIAWVVVVVWAVALIVTSHSVNRNMKRKAKDTSEYQWPKIDLALMVIVSLTIYMAIRSRRFIPIAAFIACPVIAMFINQMVRAVSAARNFHRHNRLAVSPMPRNLQLVFIFAAIGAVLFFGMWWGLKFKRVYLDPWPTDARLNSVFMRMTASDVKPFYACKFIKNNKLKGKMFNAWTEGGFIAWAQEPDPNTGRTPLQLFMDGRAQAAYEPIVFDIWYGIMGGGPVVENAIVRRRTLTGEDYVKIGQWVDRQLKKYDVWIVLMPAPQFSSGFVRGLEHNPDWSLVYFDAEQKIFANITTPQGKELLEGVFNGKTVYPNDFSKDLIMAHYMFAFGKDEVSRKQGLEFAIKACQLNPSQTPMLQVITAGTFTDLGPRVYDFCRNYYDEFMKNKNLYAKQDGYHNRAVAAMWAADYLQKVAVARKEVILAESYDDMKRKTGEQLKKLSEGKRW